MQRRLLFSLFLALLVFAVSSVLSLHFLHDPQANWYAVIHDPRTYYALSASLLLSMMLAFLMIRASIARIHRFADLLLGSILSYRDGDYSGSLYWPHRDEFTGLIELHNELAQTLRDQRQHIVQRELLLDTMLNNSPVAMFLCSPDGIIIFSNVTARQLLNGGRRLEGKRVENLIAELKDPFRAAWERSGDTLFSVKAEDAEESTYHFSRRQFSLNGRPHELILIRHMTMELRRQEMNSWKKVIRVMSHELNNSLAPMQSLAQSGLELIKRDDYQRLPTILNTIIERSHHLKNFLHAYAEFAKLPLPHKTHFDWAQWSAHLQTQYSFTLAGTLPSNPGFADPAQLQQAFLNLLKNAHESGSPAADITLRFIPEVNGVRIEVSDRGNGMNDRVLEQALIPFYSTKPSGTGLGLALTREIIEAHHGSLHLSNRPEGGVTVSVWIPDQTT